MFAMPSESALAGSGRADADVVASKETMGNPSLRHERKIPSRRIAIFPAICNRKVAPWRRKEGEVLFAGCSAERC